MKKNDVINSPSHYTQGGIQPIDYIEANNMDFLEGCIIKYITRYKYKNGLQDLKKAKNYLDRLIDREEKERFNKVIPQKARNMKMYGFK
jgi:hypothetical protein